MKSSNINFGYTSVYEYICPTGISDYLIEEEKIKCSRENKMFDFSTNLYKWTKINIRLDCVLFSISIIKSLSMNH